MRRALAGLVACSLALSACEAAKKIVTNPVVATLLKSVGPLLDLTAPGLSSVLDKTATAAQLASALQATMGSKALTLSLSSPVRSIQGVGQFGVLSTTTYFLGGVTPASEWTEIAQLVQDLFSPGASGHWYDTLPTIYGGGTNGGGSNGGAISSPTPGPTSSPGQGPGPSPTSTPGTGPTGPDGLPLSVDLRTSAPGGYQLGAIRDQGQRGTCAIFSACELLDYYYPSRLHSPEFLDWLYHLDLKSKLHPNSLWTDDGTYPHELVTLLTPQGNPNPSSTLPYVPPAQGVPVDSIAPYEDPIPTNPPTATPPAVAPGWLGQSTAAALQASAGDALQTDLLQFYLLQLKDSAGNPSVGALKQAISDGNPVMIGVPCYEPDWANIGPGNDLIADYQGQTDATGYHEILLVGYKDDSSIAGGGAFLLRNHWGTAWGDSGYAWLPFDTVVNYGEEPYVASPVSGQNTTRFTASEPPAGP